MKKQLKDAVKRVRVRTGIKGGPSHGGGGGFNGGTGGGQS